MRTLRVWYKCLLWLCRMKTKQQQQNNSYESDLSRRLAVPVYTSIHTSSSLISSWTIGTKPVLSRKHWIWLIKCTWLGKLSLQHWWRLSVKCLSLFSLSLRPPSSVCVCVCVCSPPPPPPRPLSVSVLDHVKYVAPWPDSAGCDDRSWWGFEGSAYRPCVQCCTCHWCPFCQWPSVSPCF